MRRDGAIDEPDGPKEVGMLHYVSESGANDFDPRFPRV